MAASGVAISLFRALRFQTPDAEALRKITHSGWESILSNWQMARILVSFGRDYGGLPDWVRARIDQYLFDTALRFERIKATYSIAAKALAEVKVDHVVVKGFSLFPGYAEHPKFRPSGDIDLYCLPKSILRAQQALAELGYVPNRHQGHLPVDHLATMMPKASWTSSANIFDPDMPIGFELHFCLWNESTMRFRPVGLEQFWNRRIERKVDDLSFFALHLADNLAYTALNTLRDLLLGSPSPDQVYGLGRFVHTHADNRPFWKEWLELHHPSLRRLEAISFRLAADWFDCKLPEEVEEEVDHFPVTVCAWFRELSMSALCPSFGQTKNGIWLHPLLLRSFKDRIYVLRKGLFFRGVPASREEAQSLPRATRPWSKVLRCFRQLISYLAWFVSRSAMRLAKFPSFFLHGLRIWLSAINITGKPSRSFQPRVSEQVSRHEA